VLWLGMDGMVLWLGAVDGVGSAPAWGGARVSASKKRSAGNGWRGVEI